jgi:lipopolysaccharide/colanic/teichoic acid biosynthesis glycosyltransferase
MTDSTDTSANTAAGSGTAAQPGAGTAATAFPAAAMLTAERLLETLRELNGPLYRRFGKRAFDLTAASAGTAAISPLLGAIAAVVYRTSGRPIFFRQERVGRDGEVFRIYKFRTMVPDAFKHGRGYYLEEGDPRITPAGGFLRKSSLDELPQLFNVILGDMSLVGPRPNLRYIVERYKPHYERILRERPGITCLVATRGRNSLRRSQMLAYDAEYVGDITFLGDLRILLETFPAVFLRRGASDDVSEEFLEDVEPVNDVSPEEFH